MMGRSGRRRGRREQFFSQVQDPGKDLFAYLFLVMLLFSFVILVTYEEKIRQGQKIQKSPTVTSPGTSSLVKLKNEEIGKLVKKGGIIYLLFGRNFYRPDEDVKSLEEKGIFKIIKDEAGKETKTIYIEEDPQSKIYLNEYLEAFKKLSDQGINISFARRVE